MIFELDGSPKHELEKAHEEIRNQATWVSQAEGYRAAREELKAKVETLQQDVSELKTRLANEQDKVSSASSKSQRLEERLREAELHIEKQLSLHNKDREGRIKAIRRLNQQLEQAQDRLTAEEEAHAEAARAEKRAREGKPGEWGLSEAKRAKGGEGGA